MIKEFPCSVLGHPLVCQKQPKTEPRLDTKAVGGLAASIVTVFLSVSVLSRCTRPGSHLASGQNRTEWPQRGEDIRRGWGGNNGPLLLD